jgi:hypothetical protein
MGTDAPERNLEAILIAAAIILLPRIKEFRDAKDTPALRSAVADAVRIAEFIAKHVDSIYSGR